jgi:hypothetical protein
MAGARGTFVPLTPQRRWIADLCIFSRRVPMVGIGRVLDVSRAAAARGALNPRPRWSGLVAKAWALVAAQRPELRRTYMSLPWPHLYEHPGSVASFIVERELGGEPAVMASQIGRPEALPLPVLDAEVRRIKTASLVAIGGFRRALRVARYPLVLRRALWIMMLHGSGRARARYFGTFAVNSLLIGGTEMLGATAPIAVSLYYGGVDAAGRMPVQAFFDHRVHDAVPMARALVALEEMLNTRIADELRSLLPAGADAAAEA